MIPPHRPKETINGMITQPFRNTAIAVYERPNNYPNGNYTVSVDIEFSYNDNAGQPNKTTLVSINQDMNLALGWPSSLVLSINLDNIFPTRFILEKV